MDDLKNYPKRIIEQVSFDNAHDLLLLQTDYRKLTEQHKTRRKELAQLISHFKRVLSRFPGSDPAKYYASVENECGIDGDDAVWLTPILNWYDSRYLESKRLLVVQAQNFGSAIRNYQQNLAKFDRGIDSLSRRLAANIDSNIRFEKIESIQGRLTSKVATLGYWEQLVVFTKNFDDWNRTGDGALPGREFADMVKQVSEQLQGKGRVEMKLVNLLGLEIIVTENGRNKRATHAEELRQIEARAQRVQGFAFFLRQNPSYQLQDWSERDNIPELWNQIKPLQLSIHADLGDHGLEAELIDIAQKLKTDCAVLLAKQQQRSVHAVTHGQQTSQVMPIPVCRQQIRHYFLRVRNNPDVVISALAFQQAFVNELEPAIWLACVMNECLRQQHKHYRIDYVQTDAGSLFSGNKKIKDILLCYAPPVNA